MNFRMVVSVSENSLCPKYSNCITARALNEYCCTKYKCNTYYQIDTIDLFNKAQAAMKHTNGDGKADRPYTEAFRGYNGRRSIGKRWFESISDC